MLKSSCAADGFPRVRLSLRPFALKASKLFRISCEVSCARSVILRLYTIIPLVTGLCLGQTVPSFEPGGVVPSDLNRPVPLSPGLAMSIYGVHLGPLVGCQGYGDRLCDTQVLVDGVPGKLLYVQERQINFQVPQPIPVEGTVEVRVVYNGQSSGPVRLPAGIESALVSLESPAKVGGPVWLKVLVPGMTPAVRYPYGIHPASFGCDEVEVRRDGRLVPRIATLASQAFDGIMGAGNPCGSLGLPSEPKHTGRLPLHLQYRFDQPGIYEVRYKTRMGFRSPWTPIEILPGTPSERTQWLKTLSVRAPSDPVSLLTDLLPNIMGIPDQPSFELLCRYLYHPDPLVREFAMYGLTYWPVEQADRVVMEAMRSRGPSDVALQFLSRRPEFLASQADSLVEGAIPYLHSDFPVLLRGAVTVIYQAHSKVSPAVRARAETALLDAADHVAKMADAQTVINYAAALGTCQDERAGTLLWDMVQHNVAREQAIIALTWLHAPADLPRLAQLTLVPANGHNLDRELASLPYHLRRGYGEAAIPYLETMLERSEFTWIQTQSARELMLAGRPSGFAFMVDAIESSRSYRREMIDFVRGQFPELREADDGAVLSFLKARMP